MPGAGHCESPPGLVHRSLDGVRRIDGCNSGGSAPFLRVVVTRRRAVRRSMWWTRFARADDARVLLDWTFPQADTFADVSSRLSRFAGKAAQHLLPGTNDSASGDITPGLSWTRRGPPQGCSKLCSSCAVSSGRPTTGTDREVESAVGESFVVMFEEQFVRCVERTRFQRRSTASTPGTSLRATTCWTQPHSLRPAPVFVQALMKSSVYFIDVARAKRLAQEDAAVACALAAETVQRLYLRLRRARWQHLRHRRAAVRHLLDLAACEPDGRLVTPVNQQDLANGVGSVREVVARILEELRAASLVRTSPGLVEIIDPVGMSRELWSRKA